MTNNSKGQCKHCKEFIYKRDGFATPRGFFCDFEHASKFGIDQRDKKAKRERRKDITKRRENLKTVTDHANEAQAAINAYVRLRDSGKPCISCDRPDRGDHQRHASHYRSRGACSQLRFHLMNIHASCATCNNHHSGNLIEYRIRLVDKFGPELVVWLESQNEITRYSKEYLIRLKKLFNKKTRLLKKRQDNGSYRNTG